MSEILRKTALMSKVAPIFLATTLLVAVLAVTTLSSPTVVQASHPNDNAKITATDNTGKKYEARFIHTSASPTGFRFQAVKIDGDLTQTFNFNVSPPCDSQGAPSKLLIQKQPTGWFVGYKQFNSQSFGKNFGAAGTSIQSNSFGHTLGSEIFVDSDIHTPSGVNTAHVLTYHHRSPICSALQ